MSIYYKQFVFYVNIKKIFTAHNFQEIRMPFEIMTKKLYVNHTIEPHCRCRLEMQMTHFAIVFREPFSRVMLPNLTRPFRCVPLLSPKTFHYKFISSYIIQLFHSSGLLILFQSAPACVGVLRRGTANLLDILDISRWSIWFPWTDKCQTTNIIQQVSNCDWYLISLTHW